MKLSDEELDFFKDVFNEDPILSDSETNMHGLTVQTSVPMHLRRILGSAKLTLLAEISHYQLWFPVSLRIGDSGDFTPSLGIPEIIDIQGVERSWRVNSLDNVSILDAGEHKGIQILSLSSTGLTLKADSPLITQNPFLQKEINLILPNQKKVTLVLDPVRQDGGIVAAKFKTVGKNRETLRKFIFNLHRTAYSDLYKNI